MSRRFNNLRHTIPETPGVKDIGWVLIVVAFAGLLTAAIAVIKPY